MQGLLERMDIDQGSVSVVPLCPVSHVERISLRNRLRESRQRLCLLCGPAGSGKSVLVADALHDDPRVFWVSLEGRPLSLAELCDSLCTALGMQPLGAPALLKALARITAPLRLVLDDLPGERSIEMNAWFEQLMAIPSPGFQIVISCRERPGWNLSRLALRGELLELGWNELAMSRTEFDTLCNLAGWQADGERAEEVFEASAGWWAGARLLMEHGSEGRRLLRDYLGHELLARLDVPERSVLYALAHVPRFSVELCDQLWPEQGALQSLRRLQQKQAFIFPVEGRSDWHQLMPLIGDLLQDRLPPVEINRLRLHACRLLSIAGHFNEAIEQAIRAEQPEVAATYMEKLQPSWALTEHHLYRLLEWREQLPRQLLDSTPRLVQLNAVALLCSGRAKDALECLGGFARFTPAANPAHQRRLLANWQALQGLGLALQGHFVDAERHCTEALAVLTEEDWVALVLCHSTLARLWMLKGRMEEAASTLQAGLERSRRIGCLDSELLLESDRARLLVLSDQLELAEALLDDAIGWRRHAHITRDPMLARLHFLRAEILLRQGRLKECERSLATGHLHAAHCNAPFVLQGELLSIELEALGGRHQQARALLLRAERRLQRCRSDRRLYEAPLVLQQLQMLAGQGDWEGVRRRHAAHDGILRSLLMWPCLQLESLLLLAEAEMRSGRSREAHARLCEVLADARSKGYRAVQARAQDLLDGLRQQRAEEESCIPLAEDLTPREMAVLRWLARGLSNQEIADRIHLSVNTVKYHAKNINSKLGSSRRTQAIVLAKRLGLLD